MKPQISVIVPVYKAEPYLRRCVDSILGQTYSNLDVILVDDGSPDRCGAICEEYAAKDGRVRVIHKENGGLSDARNAGLSAMRGEYVTFVDSDDWLEPTALATLYGTMELFRADLVIGGHDRIEDGTGRQLSTHASPEASRVMDRSAAMEQALTQGCAAWARLYKKEIHHGIFFPVGEINEDEAIVLSLLERCGRVAETGETVYHYRCRPESITTARFSAGKLVWITHCRENLNCIQEKHPKLTPFAAARYRSSVLWGLREMALSGQDFERESRQLIQELRDNAALFDAAPFANGGDKLRYLLLKHFPLWVYKGILRLRHGG